MQWYRAKVHVCVEPYGPYAEVLRQSRYEVLQQTALEGLRQMAKAGDKFEAVYLLDVIEHMEKAEGLEAIELAKQVATRQIVIFTPNGFEPQSGDVWGYGGDHWQEHRSGWEKQDFPGFVVTETKRSIFAVWTP